MFFNGLLMNGFIMATEPLMAVLMLGQLGSRRGSTASRSRRPASAA
jgi:hypothetical protein